MLRWNQIVVAALFVATLPLAAQAQNFSLVGGEFTFEHAPVDRDHPDWMDWSIPAAVFNVASQSFGGHLVASLVGDKGTAFPGKGAPITPSQLAFTGSGEAIGYVYLDNTRPQATDFSGSFQWEIGTDTLHGTFSMQNYSTDDPDLFGALIFIRFQGGTGRFTTASGHAYAEGIDRPFGGLGDAAGVTASIVSGNLKFK